MRQKCQKKNTENDVQHSETCTLERMRIHFFTFMATTMATPLYTTHYIVGRIVVVHQRKLANKSHADFKILKLARDLPGFTASQ